MSDERSSPESASQAAAEEDPVVSWEGPGDDRRDFSTLFDWLGVETPDASSTDSGEEGPAINGTLPPVAMAGLLSKAGVRGTVEKIRSRKLSRLSPDRPVVLFDRDEGAHGCLLPGRTDDGGWVYHAFRHDRAAMDAREALRKSLRYVLRCEPVGHRDKKDLPGGEGIGQRGWFWSVIWGLRRDFLAVFPASLLINVFALAMPLFIMNVYDRVIPNDATETLWVLAIGVALVFTFEFLIRLIRGAFVDHAGKSADRQLSARIFRQLLEIDLSHRPPSAGNLASKARAYESVRDFLSAASLVTLVDFPFALLMIGVVFWVGGPVGWIPVVATSCVLLVLLVLQPFLRRLSNRSQENLINRQSLMAESANGLETVKAANADLGLEDVMDEQVAAATDIDLQARRLTQMGTSITVFFIHLTTVGVIVGGAFLVKDQSLSMGGLIACVMITGRSMAPLNTVSNLMLRLQGTLASLRGLDELMELPRETQGDEFRTQIRKPEFRLVNACLTYPEQPIASLDDINLQIRPGEKVGLIGRAGSGKTTLLRLLGRQLMPTSGLVMIDGIDMRQLHPSDVRRSCAYLPQDGVLFHGSIRRNIALARPDATDEMILKAATETGVTSWSNRHPAGLNMQVGERGVLLSGGQRQSVLWARCLITEPEALLLDEPTASMDLTTERRFSEALGRYLDSHESSTLVLATHKMHLLSLIDRLVVLEQGKIIADGPRDAVLAALKKRKIEEMEAASARQGSEESDEPTFS